MLSKLYESTEVDEPSSVFLSQTKVVKKLQSCAPKVSNLAKAKRDGVIKPLHYNFSQF